MPISIQNLDYSKVEYADDCERIVKLCFSRGILLSPIEAELAWEEHSESSAAGWLFLPESDEELWLSLPSWARGEHDDLQR